MSQNTYSLLKLTSRVLDASTAIGWQSGIKVKIDSLTFLDFTYLSHTFSYLYVDWTGVVDIVCEGKFFNNYGYCKVDL